MQDSDLEAIWEVITPLHLDWIQVEVSALCNAACAYCVLTCYKEQWGGDLMDIHTFERLQPAFSLADMIFLQGWGEPLLHSEFWDMARAVKSTGAKLGFTTNGTPLVDKNISKLFEEGVDIMGVSLAGATAATHERFRQGCDFAHIDKALTKINKMKQRHPDQGPSVNLAFMLLWSNWREVDQLPALAAKWGINQIVVSNLSVIGSEAMRNESLLLKSEMWPQVSAALEKAKQEAADRGIPLHYHKPCMHRRCAICTENVLKACFVSYRGDVSPCVMTNISIQPGSEAQYWFENEIYPVENYSFGNISEHSLPEIWKGTKARRFRAAFEKRLNLENPGTRQLPTTACRHCYKLVEE